MVPGLGIMSKHIKAALLDLDGTLVHYETAHVVSEVKRITVELDLPEPTEQHIRYCIAQGTMSKLISESLNPDFESLFWKMFSEEELYPMRLLPKVIPTLKQLTDLGMKLALVTARDSDETQLYRHLEDAGIRDFFSTVVTKRRLSPPWSGKESYFQSAMRELQLLPHQVVSVGDRPSDARSAKAVGVSLNILVRTGGIEESVLRDSPCHHLVDDISHLPSLLLEPIS